LSEGGETVSPVLDEKIRAPGAPLLRNGQDHFFAVGIKPLNLSGEMSDFRTFYGVRHTFRRAAQIFFATADLPGGVESRLVK